MREVDAAVGERTVAGRWRVDCVPLLEEIQFQLLGLVGSGAPVFRHGSAASDDLHAVLEQAPQIARVVGHSKGSLAIANALRSLPPERAEQLSVLTFGCVITEELEQRNYAQYLGLFDPLGILNSWGHRPEKRLLSHHSTNTLIPLSMTAAALVKQTVATAE